MYQLIISPIEYLIEVVFTIMNGFFGHEGYAIIAVSVAISTLVLPLYLRADAIQEEEQNKQKQMEHWLAHIKKTFRGDERLMMTNAYYAEMQYKPLYALKGLIPLLLQIPFFIAAYHFLSNLQCIQGRSFWLIADLGAEDGMLRIGGRPVNLLPVLMTAINLVSSVIYTKEAPLKQKIQPVVLALVFLVLLYHSPAGLVLYWTMNNLYSLCKNIVMKSVEQPKRFLHILLLLAAAALALCLAVKGRWQTVLRMKDHETLLLYLAVEFMLCLPALKHLLPGKGCEEQSGGSESSRGCVLILEAALSILIGVVIPLLVISDSPMDFLVLDQNTDPLHYAVFAGLVAAGYFLVWGNVVYGMLTQKAKRIYTEGLFLLLLCGLLNMLAFPAKVGNVSTMLEFDFLPKFSLSQKVLNLILLMTVIAAGHLIWHYLHRLAEGISLVLLLSLLVMAGHDMILTRQGMHEVRESAEKTEYIVPLSKEGRNVILIMLDRAVSGYLPFLFDEKPQLVEQFAGFTYYPNTLSFGINTEEGAPALYGGYDYTTERELERTDSTREELHEEALKVLPVVFGETGYQVTVTDPAFGKPEDIDLSIFDEYPYVKAYSLERNLPTGYKLEDYVKARERNFFFYALYRIMPAVLQPRVYDTGGYLAADRSYFMGEDNFRFGNTVLKNLPELTRIEDGAQDRFLSFCNNTAHAHVLLNLPDYTDERIPDYTGIDIYADKVADGRVLHFRGENENLNAGTYHANMAAYLGLGKWFDYLRACGVFDRCRIVLVSDHGFDLRQFDEMNLGNGVDVQAVNPILLVKDFDDNAPFRVDDSFMTNADTAALLTEGLIDTPRNPFTGSVLDTSGKEGGVNILWSSGEWFHVEKDIFDESNWTRTGRE
ncbi:MAG: membrane protein insertase YidC [Lachnospiraceae bacterium]|nr:membrane protein insertase YidC [Lachnospiraceae bacterium]